MQTEIPTFCRLQLMLYPHCKLSPLDFSRLTMLYSYCIVSYHHLNSELAAINQKSLFGEFKAWFIQRMA